MWYGAFLYTIYYITEVNYQIVKSDNALPTRRITSCQQNRSILTNRPLYTICLVSESWERYTKKLVKNLCLSCKHVYNTDNITVEQKDVHDKNFCPVCWEVLKMWDASKHS